METSPHEQGNVQVNGKGCCPWQEFITHLQLAALTSGSRTLALVAGSNWMTSESCELDLSTASRQDAHSNIWLGARIRVCISLPVLGFFGCWGDCLLSSLWVFPCWTACLLLREFVSAWLKRQVGRQGKEGNAAGCVCARLG